MKLKLQYFGYLMQRAHSLEKTLMLGIIEGKRRGQQRMRWLDAITDSMDMSLSRLNGHAAAAAAKSLQSCPTLCDPIDGSPPASPSLGFSRQKRGSGLPFPSPMHESEK